MNKTRKSTPISVPLQPEVEARFWDKVDMSGGPDACWAWKAGRIPHGYGHFFLPIVGEVIASRVAYALRHGSDPKGLSICHTCDNPPCCNPAHLFAGTHRDNMTDMDRKGRRRAKLTIEQVHAIRELIRQGVSQRKIARDFGIAAQSAISKIACGKAWHLEPVHGRAKSCRPETTARDHPTDE